MVRTTKEPRKPSAGKTRTGTTARRKRQSPQKEVETGQKDEREVQPASSAEPAACVEAVEGSISCVNDAQGNHTSKAVKAEEQVSASDTDICNREPEPSGEASKAEQPDLEGQTGDFMRGTLLSEESVQDAEGAMFRGAGAYDIAGEGEAGAISGTAVFEALQHGRRVGLLALSLFDGLQTVHALNTHWRAILVQAALWHDLGFAVGGRKAHHKRSMSSIASNPGLQLSFGLSEQDRPLVALLARYHRKSWPSEKHKAFAALNEADQDALKKAASLLRLADALDYTHEGCIEELRVKVRRRSVELTCVASGSCRKELERAEEKGDLFVDLFKVRLHLESVKGEKKHGH